MPIPDILLARNRGGDVGGYELSNGSTLTQIGANIPGVVARTNGGDNYAEFNDIIEFKGSKYLVSQTLTMDPEYRIYKFTGGSWTQVHSVGPSALTNDARNMGSLFTYNDGIDIKLAFIFQKDSVTSTLSHSADGSSWTDTDISHSSFSFFGQGNFILHKNELFFAERATVGVIQFDLVGFASTSFQGGQIPWTGGASEFFEQDGNLYIVALDVLSGGDWRIYKFTGAGFVAVADITTGNRYSSIARNATLQGRGSAVAIGTDVYLWLPGVGSSGGSNYGSTFFHLDLTGPDTWTITENDTVIPAPLRQGVRGTSSNNGEDRWMMFIDTETNPTAPEIYGFVRPGGAPGTGTTLYKFVDTSTEMTFETASVSTEYVFPKNLQGGSEAVSRGTGNRAEVVDTQGVSGGTQVSYRVYGTNLGQTVKAYITDDGGVAVTQAVLTGAATGGSSTRVGNQINNVDGDDGVTLYTFIIENLGSGLGPGEPFYVKLDIQ